MRLNIILSETQFNKIMKNMIQESYKFDPDIEKIQKDLKGKYNLGNSGINKDGVDGLLGPLTKKAMISAMSKNPTLKDQYGKLLKKYGFEKDYEYDKKTLINKGDEILGKSDVKITKGIGGDSSDVVILMGGLDYRQGDYKIDGQIKILNKGISKPSKVIGHRYNDLNSVINSIEKYPNAKVVLFSAGCAYADKISQIIKNKENLFIVEPYGKSPKTKNSVQSAVANGVPELNVITGPSVSRGLDIVGGTTKTPQNSNHWDALEFVGSKIS